MPTLNDKLKALVVEWRANPSMYRGIFANVADRIESILNEEAQVSAVGGETEEGWLERVKKLFNEYWGYCNDGFLATKEAHLEAFIAYLKDEGFGPHKAEQGK